jgi:CRP/FNR family transcriptional regulator, cyclic AMP receptor protein
VNAIARPSANVCYVLLEDPELAEGIEPELRAQALDTVIAREIQVPAGAWRTRRPPGIEDGLGLLVLDGVLLHRIGIDQRFGAELLGQGDVLRPAQGHGESTLPLTNDWLVLESSRLAVLDERFVRQLAQYPQLAGSLFARAVERSRQLAVNMAIVHQARVDVRLHMLFWHLAGRWGRVRSDGVLVPLRLTHSVLADLVAARRPTVTSALSDLGRRGMVVPVREGWLLSGEPPAQVNAGPAATSRS